jgi:hypothetical protein
MLVAPRDSMQGAHHDCALVLSSQQMQLRHTRKAVIVVVIVVPDTAFKDSSIIDRLQLQEAKQCPYV